MNVSRESERKRERERNACRVISDTLNEKCVGYRGRVMRERERGGKGGWRIGEKKGKIFSSDSQRYSFLFPYTFPPYYPKDQN